MYTTLSYVSYINYSFRGPQQYWRLMISLMKIEKSGYDKMRYLPCTVIYAQGEITLSINENLILFIHECIINRRYFNIEKFVPS